VSVRWQPADHAGRNPSRTARPRRAPRRRGQGSPTRVHTAPALVDNHGGIAWGSVPDLAQPAGRTPTAGPGRRPARLPAPPQL